MARIINAEATQKAWKEKKRSMEEEGEERGADAVPEEMSLLSPEVKTGESPCAGW